MNFYKSMTPAFVLALALTGVLLLGPLESSAAIPKSAMSPPPNILFSKSGETHSVQGGMSGRYTSLLDLRSSSNKSGGLERIVVDIGDEMKRKLVGRVGYYTVEMRGQEVVISFRQTLNSVFSENKLSTRLKASPYVAKSRLHFEPLTQTTNLILNLKRTAKLHVYSISGSRQTGKLILDFSPAVL